MKVQNISPFNISRYIPRKMDIWTKKSNYLLRWSILFNRIKWSARVKILYNQIIWSEIYLPGNALLCEKNLDANSTTFWSVSITSIKQLQCRHCQLVMHRQQMCFKNSKLLNLSYSQMGGPLMLWKFTSDNIDYYLHYLPSYYSSHLVSMEYLIPSMKCFIVDWR